jgi:hypothetical protein
VIQLHCDNGNDVRLARVLVYILTHAERQKIPDAEKLTALRHHGGALTAYYSSVPSNPLKHVVEAAWTEENEVVVVHQVDSHVMTP